MGWKAAHQRKIRLIPGERGAQWGPKKFFPKGRTMAMDWPINLERSTTAPPQLTCSFEKESLRGMRKRTKFYRLWDETHETSEPGSRPAGSTTQRNARLSGSPPPYRRKYVLLFFLSRDGGTKRSFGDGLRRSGSIRLMPGSRRARHAVAILTCCRVSRIASPQERPCRILLPRTKGIWNPTHEQHL